MRGPPYSGCQLAIGDDRDPTLFLLSASVGAPPFPHLFSPKANSPKASEVIRGSLGRPRGKGATWTVFDNDNACVDRFEAGHSCVLRVTSRDWFPAAEAWAAVRSAIAREVSVYEYARLALRGLQGRIVPVLHGVWAAPGVASDNVARLAVWGQREIVIETEVWVMLMSDEGERVDVDHMTEPERCVRALSLNLLLPFIVVGADATPRRTLVDSYRLLHAAEIPHGDAHPRNWCITPGGQRPMIVDFGLGECPRAA